MGRERLETSIISKRDSDVMFNFVKYLKLPMDYTQRFINMLKHCIGLANLYYNYSLELEKEIRRNFSINESHDIIKKAWDRTN